MIDLREQKIERPRLRAGAAAINQSGAKKSSYKKNTAFASRSQEGADREAIFNMLPNCQKGGLK
ncbi:MAG TPA: hypothetical protein ENH24_03480 [Nitrospirae bacterium]|nr:hypothetical protein [Nitrospirota bacterium]